MNPIKYYEFEHNKESYVVPINWLSDHDKQIRADERERIIRELEKLSDSYFQKVALDIIDIAIEIARGEENEN